MYVIPPSGLLYPYVLFARIHCVYACVLRVGAGPAEEGEMHDAKLGGTNQGQAMLKLMHEGRRGRRRRRLLLGPPHMHACIPYRFRSELHSTSNSLMAARSSDGLTSIARLFVQSSSHSISW